MDYDDFLTGVPRTFTIAEVRKGPSAEQPVEIAMDEFERPWRPAKSMRRILVAAWGADASQYVGKRVSLFGDPTVKWAGQAVGGIRVKALSHIDGPLTVALTVTRGKRAPFVVEPLKGAPVDTVAADEWLEAIKEASTMPQLLAAWEGATKAAVTKDQRLIDAKDRKKEQLSKEGA